MHQFVWRDVPQQHAAPQVWVGSIPQVEYQGAVLGLVVLVGAACSVHSRTCQAALAVLSVPGGAKLERTEQPVLFLLDSGCDCLGVWQGTGLRAALLGDLLQGCFDLLDNLRPDFPIGGSGGAASGLQATKAALAVEFCGGVAGLAAMACRGCYRPSYPKSCVIANAASSKHDYQSCPSSTTQANPPGALRSTSSAGRASSGRLSLCMVTSAAVPSDVLCLPCSREHVAAQTLTCMESPCFLLPHGHQLQSDHSYLQNCLHLSSSLSSKKLLRLCRQGYLPFGTHTRGLSL